MEKNEAASASWVASVQDRPGETQPALREAQSNSSLYHQHVWGEDHSRCEQASSVLTIWLEKANTDLNAAKHDFRPLEEIATVKISTLEGGVQTLSWNLYNLAHQERSLKSQLSQKDTFCANLGTENKRLDDCLRSSNEMKEAAQKQLATSKLQVDSWVNSTAKQVKL